MSASRPAGFAGEPWRTPERAISTADQEVSRAMGVRVVLVPMVEVDSAEVAGAPREAAH